MHSLRLPVERATVVDNTRSFRAEGDDSMYTPEALEARAALEHHPEVEARLENFWNLVLASLPTVQVGQDGSALLPRDAFLEFQLRVCRALFDDADWDLRVARRVVRGFSHYRHS